MTANVVPISGNTPFAQAVRRVVLFDRAREELGGQVLADALGVGRRAINHKIATDRSLTDADLTAAAAAIEARAVTLVKLGADLRAMTVHSDGR